MKFYYKMHFLFADSYVHYRKCSQFAIIRLWKNSVWRILKKNVALAVVLNNKFLGTQNSKFLAKYYFGLTKVQSSKTILVL